MKRRKRIFLCCITTLMMALVMAVPMSVSAAETAETEVTSGEAFIEAVNKAQNGDIIKVSGNIECNSAVTIDDSITITGGSIKFATDDSNSLTILNGAEVTFNDTTISNTAGKSVIHAWGAKIIADKLTVKHGGSTGAPIIVNNGSSAVFTNLNLELGANSWYGVNVDNAYAKFKGVTVDDTNGTQSVICSENNGKVECSEFTKVETAKDGGDKVTAQTAYVTDENLPQFIAAKTTSGNDVTNVYLQGDVYLSEPLTLSEAMSVNGYGHTINGTSTVGENNVVTIVANDVVLSDLVIKTDAANKSALHVYEANDAVLKNVTLDNTYTVGGAGLIVNGATVDIDGTLDLILGENSWGGINVDTKIGDSTVNFLKGSSVAVSGVGAADKAVIYQDDGQDPAVVNGAEAAGLVRNADGSYVIAADQPATGRSGSSCGRRSR